MSVDYAAGLSHYDDLGVCGLDEVLDKWTDVKEKVCTLAEWLRSANGSCVIHVGAGLSTSAGIPDFRGKSGVWTKLLSESCVGDPKVSKQSSSSFDDRSTSQVKTQHCDQPHESTKVIKPFDETEPTISHMILRELCSRHYVSHIISQNVDGLFLKANLPRKFISELHGNFYLDECTKCRSRYIRAKASETMRLQKSAVRCPRPEPTCTGHLRDTILDWESPIPYNELRTAQKESKRNKLHICIGTSMQLRPSKDLVCDPRKQKSTKLVIINLQPVQFDKMANLVINYYADDVMKLLADELDLTVPKYDAKEDPTKHHGLIGTLWQRV